MGLVKPLTGAERLLRGTFIVQQSLAPTPLQEFESFGWALCSGAKARWPLEKREGEITARWRQTARDGSGRQDPHELGNYIT